MRTKLFGYISFALFFAGCAVGPDYQAPAPELPASFGEAPENSVPESDRIWWSGFNDPLLNELIEQAALNNKDVLQALSRINQARALARAASAELLPGLQLGGSYDKGQQSGARFPSGGPDRPGSSPSFEYEVWEGSIDALWEIDIFGGLRRNLEARTAEYHASVAQLNDVLRIVIAETATTYFSLRGAQNQLRIARRNLELQEKTMDVAQAKLEAGATSELDTARARAQLENTRASIPPLESSVKTNIHRLSVLLGKQPKELQAELLLVQDLPRFQGPLTIPQPGELLRRRPDLRAAERNLAAQTALIGAAIAELYPKIQVSGSIGVAAAEFTDLTKGAGTYNFGPRISWTPLDSGRLRAQARAQSARAEEALLAYEQRVLAALEDVENSLSRYSTQLERTVQLQTALNAASRAQEISQEQYREGVIDFLSVLEAQSTVLENERQLARSEEEAITALVGIYKALGGGWENWEIADKDTSPRISPTSGGI